MKRKNEILEGITKDVISSKFVGRNTLKVEYADKTTGYRLHNTDVVTKGENFISLSSGGWRTATTKERINTFSPFKVWQEKGLWSVHTPAGTFAFFDGITFDLSGKLKGKGKSPNIQKIEKTKKKISKFVAGLTKENLPIPSTGDCWMCCLRDEKGVTWGDNRGDNHDHLQQHIQENYLHGSLLVNAMREYGYRDEQIGIHYQLKLADTFKRSLRRYLQKRLIPEIATR